MYIKYILMQYRNQICLSCLIYSTVILWIKSADFIHVAINRKLTIQN